MALRPQETIQKVLISTTSYFTGEYENRNVMLAHAFPNLYDQSALIRWSEGPASRSAFILAFETGPIDDQPGVPLPDYSTYGEFICTYLATLFGKRFDCHGIIEGNGIFHIPDLSQFGCLCNHHLPHNSHDPRIDFSVPLNLSEISRIENLFFDTTLDSKFVRTFTVAAKFYLQALQNVESDPEVAYLHLITAGEILSNFYEYNKDQLLDDEITQVLTTIRTSPAFPEGEKVAKIIEDRLWQVRKRFVKTIVQLIGQDFFERSEAYQPVEGQISVMFKAASFEKSVSAAYDLRSWYVHRGTPFGKYISPGHRKFEVQSFPLAGKDKELGRILTNAPTFIGLERIMRYSLLQFAKLNGAYVEPMVKQNGEDVSPQGDNIYE